MKILNLYAGIGGNRKLWGDIHHITAVELDPRIAEIYKDLYPGDTVVIGDVHQFPFRTLYGVRFCLGFATMPVSLNNKLLPEC